MARMIKCIKLGVESEGLDFPPYPGELGKRIYNEISKEAWQMWLKHQTMLVNENRLSLADQRARQRGLSAAGRTNDHGEAVRADATRWGRRLY